MSRVHDALRKAEKSGEGQSPAPEPRPNNRPSNLGVPPMGVSAAAVAEAHSLHGLLDLIPEIPYNPSREALLIDTKHPDDAPAENVPSLRTRLKPLQIHH